MAALVTTVLVWTATRVPDPRAEFFGAWRFSGLVINLAATFAIATGASIAFAPRPRRRRLFQVLAVTLGLLLGGLAFEGPAWIFGFDWRGPLGVDAQLLPGDLRGRANRFDPVLIHLHWPNARYEGRVKGDAARLFDLPGAEAYPVDLRLDSRGFRNDRDLEKTDVVVIGDSFVESPLVESRWTLSRRLEERLGRSVVNLGQSGYGLRQELEVLRRFARPLRPAWVVWVFFGGNDLDEVDLYEKLLAQGDRPSPPAPLARRLFLRNALRRLSMALSKGVEPDEGLLGRTGTFERADGTAERIWFMGPPPRVHGDHAWQVARETLAAAARESAAEGSKFLLVFVPRKFVVYRDHVRLHPGSPAASWPEDDQNLRLGAIAAELGVRYCDLTEPLRTAVARGIPVFFADDSHWNAEGNAVALESIAPMLD